ncbi:hypothetical protein JCM10914A_30670 [Paenibacillus sp. JCM 10914]
MFKYSKSLHWIGYLRNRATVYFFVVIFFFIINNVADASSEGTMKRLINDFSNSKVETTSNTNKGQELILERDAFSKTFQNPDKTFTTTISNGAMHYKVGEKWENIDTRIVNDQSEAGFDLGVSKNIFKVKLNKNSSKPIRIAYDNAAISYQALGTNSVVGRLFDNSVIYENMWNYTDVSYTVNSSGVKMLIHLKNVHSPKEFQFQISHQNLSSRLNDDGSVDFTSVKGDIQYSIPPMWVRDDSSENVRYEPIKLELGSTKQGSILTIKLDDSGLEYPILIDPTTDVSKNMPHRGGQTRNLSTGFRYGIPSSHIHQIKIDTHLTCKVDTGGEFDTWPSRSSCNTGLYVADLDMQERHVRTYSAMAGLISFRIFGDEIRAINPIVSNVVSVGVRDMEGDTHNGMEIKTHITGQLTVSITYDRENEDTIPPSSPTGLIARNFTSKTVNLTWNPSTDNLGVIQYKIYNNEIEIGSTVSNTPEFEVKDLQGGATYKFTVRAIDGAGNLSYNSNTLTFTPDDIPPTKPGNLSVESLNSNTVTLSWNSSTDNIGIKNYRIYKDGMLLGYTLSTNYIVLGLEDNKFYRFSVVAVDTSDNTSEETYIDVKTSGKYSYYYENGRLSFILNGAGKKIREFHYDRNGNLIKVFIYP